MNEFHLLCSSSNSPRAAIRANRTRHSNVHFTLFHNVLVRTHTTYHWHCYTIWCLSSLFFIYWVDSRQTFIQERCKMLIYAYIFQHRSLANTHTHITEHRAQYCQKHCFEARSMLLSRLHSMLLWHKLKTWHKLSWTNERNGMERMWQAAMSSSSSSLFKCASKCVCLEWVTFKLLTDCGDT